MAALGELWPPAKKVGGWLLDQAAWVLSFFEDAYSVKGWVLAPLILFALVTVVRYLVGLKAQHVPAFASYVEDHIFGAKWRWSWVAGEVSNLWCFCPRCDSELVYDDSSCNSFSSTAPSKTDFICEHCHCEKVATILGGNKSYALSAVQREIRRRVRTNEYAQTNQAGS